jgi:hypothetical protein
VTKIRLFAVLLFASFVFAIQASASDATLVADLTFNSSGALAQTAASTVLTGTVFGDALVTNGGLKVTNGGYVVPFSFELSPQTGTVAVVARADRPQDSDLTYLSADSGAPYLIRIMKDNSFYGCVRDTQTGWTCVQSPAHVAPTGQTHRFVLTWNGTLVQIYLDGRLQAAKAYIPYGTSGLLYGNSIAVVIGGASWWPDGSNHFYSGTIYEVQIYNGALTNAQISTQAAATLPKN